MEEVTSLASEAGLPIVEDDGDGWQNLKMLAEAGPEAFTRARARRVPADEPAVESATTLYLREIGERPLLTADEEVALAKLIEAGRTARQQLAQTTAEQATRSQLEAAVQAGEVARRRLIESNLRLVVSVARRFMGRGLSLLDLIQEGNLGLGRAIEKYDWRRGFRFSTYAYWWIRQAIGRAAAEQGRTIRLPVPLIEQLTRLHNASQELHDQLKREPTPEEIAARLGVKPERVRDALQAARAPISLDTPVSAEDESTVADLLADATSTTAQDAEQQVLADSLNEALQEYLDPREATVLCLRFGLGEEPPRTLREIAAEVGLTSERVRQIEAQALRKLRRVGPFKDRFHDYVE
jgi:RNA polymerase primary sigma factor